MRIERFILAGLVSSVSVSLAADSQSIAKYAREHGFGRCVAALETAERNLMRGSDYSFNAAYPATKSDRATINLFNALIDSRKRDANDPIPRATTNLTVIESATPGSCSTLYEQTVYHTRRCDDIAVEMAPSGKRSTNVSYGSVLIEVATNLSLTLIPVGTAQCVSVLKEWAFDVALPPAVDGPATK